MGFIQGVVFDKDGTLFDFRTTWGGWTRRLMLELAGGGAARARVLGHALGYDITTARFAPDSVVIAETPERIAAVLMPHLTGITLPALIARMNALAAETPLAEAVPLRPFLSDLRAQGLRLGLATNDGETPARAHLAAAGVAHLFDFVAGYDSGYGGKPEPGQLLAFADRCGVAPARTVMIGDSRHDMRAGRAAGMRTVAVLTGIALAADLAPFADAVLPDIGHLPAWLATPGAAAPV